jgi:hypothetical protein
MVVVIFVFVILILIPVPSPDSIVLSGAIDIEEPDQVSDTQSAQSASFSLSERSIRQPPLILLQFPDTFINAILDAQSPHVNLLRLADSMTSVHCLVLCSLSAR